MFTFTTLPQYNAKPLAKMLGCKPRKLRWGLISSNAPASSPPMAMTASVVTGPVDSVIGPETQTVWLVAYTKRSKHTTTGWTTRVSFDTAGRPFVPVAVIPHAELETYARNGVWEAVVAEIEQDRSLEDIEKFLTNYDRPLATAVEDLSDSPVSQLAVVAALRKADHGEVAEHGPALIERLDIPFRVLAIRAPGSAHKSILDRQFAAVLEPVG